VSVSSHSIRELAPPPLTHLAPKPGGCGAFAGRCIAHFLRGLDQARQLCLGVVRRDATTSMPEQVLTILERHTRRAQPATEGVPRAPEPLSRPCCSSWSPAATRQLSCARARIH
jgi:hypothetical protein